MSERGSDNGPSEPSDLSSLIATQEYVPGPGLEGVNLNAIDPNLVVNEAQGVAGQADSSQAQGAPIGEAPPNDQANQGGVTTSPDDPFASERSRYERLLQERDEVLRSQQAQAQNLEGIALRLAQERIQNEDQAYYASLESRVEAGDLDPKEAVRLTRDRERTRADNMSKFLKSQEQKRIETNQAQEVNRLRTLTVAAVMMQEGFPDSVRPILEAAQSPEHFDVLVSSLKAAGIKAQQSAPVQQQPVNDQQAALAAQNALRASGALVAGGEDGGTPPPPPPKEGSGDLSGLLASRGYEWGTGYGTRVPQQK